jgi:Zn-dependent protease with chaperone function
MMDYKPSLPAHNDNVSHDRPAREFLILFSGLTIIFLAVFFVLGAFVDLAVNYISPEMEAKIFFSLDPADTSLRGPDDPRTAALQRLLDELQPCAGIGYPLKVYLVDTKDANAVAFPGGRIAVFSGLLDKVHTENGLSFILAHELAHYKNRDHLRGMGRGIVLTAMMAFLTGSDSGLTRLFAPAASFSQARYSQKREILADTSALEILVCRYGHAGGATEFFEAMKPDEDGNKIGLYFSSHPEAVQRIDNLLNISNDQGIRSEVGTPLPEILSPGQL